MTGFAQALGEVLRGFAVVFDNENLHGAQI
jgi:hypothetical protein